MRIALAQINPTVGDLRGNRKLAEEAAERAQRAGAQLVVLPEMALTGYPPQDLLERQGFLDDQLSELDALLPASRGIAIALGVVLPTEPVGPRSLANAAVVLEGGRLHARQDKSLLPTYDVFDEKRWFLPAAKREPAVLADGTRLGLAVCEDSWAVRIPYGLDPVAELVESGAELLLNLSASPWHAGKSVERRSMLCEVARSHAVPLVFVNQLGGNDELVFDGGSCLVDASGRVCAALPLFEPALEVVDLEAPPLDLAAGEVQELSGAAELEAGLVLGIRDYFGKQGLPSRAVIGLSGGIDSAVTAHLAARALGPENVLGVLMPGPFSSSHSIRDAEQLARNLGIEARTVDIRPIYDAYMEIFAGLLGARDDYGLAGQNIQARARGSILMAVSNAEGRLVLATGNKSELSVGYCTLYGDMVGGLAVLGDVCKGDVYALAREANRDRERVPASTIEKPPSAELAPDQRDEDDLPPYDVLDAILRQAVELGRTQEGIQLPPGGRPEHVAQVLGRLDRNEYKRRQGPLVLRTSPKAFGSGRRLPIVHRYPADGSA